MNTDSGIYNNEISKIGTEKAWLDRYQHQLSYIATALCCAGVLYLLAANWFYLPRFLQLYVPQVLLLLSCGAVYFFAPSTIKGQCAATCAAIMTGLSLATYGQIYQTGADSYQLFAVWSILLLPWLYYRLSSVYIIFSSTSLLTLFLASNQVLFLSNNSMLLLASLILLIQIIIAEFFFKAARPLLILIISGLAIIAVLFASEDNLWWIMAILLPAVASAMFYYRGWPIGVAIGVLTLVIVTSTYITTQAHVIDFTDPESFFFIALLLFLWCYGISKILQLLLPKNISLSLLPAAFGAWISSFFLTLFLATLFISGGPSLLIFLGLFLLIGGMIGLKNSQHIFIRQMLYAITLSGQICIVFNLNYFHYFSGYWFGELLIAIQLIIVICSWLMLKNQFWQSLQLCILIAYCHFFFPYLTPWLLLLPFIIWTISADKAMNNLWRYPLLVATFLLILLSVFSDLFLSSYYYLSFDGFNPPRTNQFIFAILAVIGLFLQRRHLNQILLLTFIVLALVLIALHQYNILVLLAALAIVVQRKDSFMLFLLMLTLAFCLWSSYYNLSAPLIKKGAIIIASGLAIAIVSAVIARQLKQYEQYQQREAQ